MLATVAVSQVPSTSLFPHSLSRCLQLYILVSFLVTLYPTLHSDNYSYSLVKQPFPPRRTSFQTCTSAGEVVKFVHMRARAVSSCLASPYPLQCCKRYPMIQNFGNKHIIHLHDVEYKKFAKMSYFRVCIYMDTNHKKAVSHTLQHANHKSHPTHQIQFARDLAAMSPPHSHC